jgi:hypothetical protein
MRYQSLSLTAHLVTAARTSVVNLHLTEPRHPQIYERFHEVRSLVTDFTDRPRSRLSCPSPSGNELAACLTMVHVAMGVQHVSGLSRG